MGQERRRTCASCRESFTPDPRNARHQRYCGQPACRVASKRASQAKWLAKPENCHYHRGAAAVARVRAWRQAHPGYSRRTTGAPSATPAALAVSLAPFPPDSATTVKALQGACNAPSLASQGALPQRSGAPLQDLMGSPLQEILASQPYVLIGLIGHLWDCALQEDIVSAGARLLQLGRDICGGDHVHT
jgi:hypothetical protein